MESIPRKNTKSVKHRTRHSILNKPTQSILKAVGGKLVVHSTLNINNNDENNADRKQQSIPDEAKRKIKHITRKRKVNNSDNDTDKISASPKKSRMITKGLSKKRKVLVFKDEVQPNISLPPTKRRKIMVGGVLVDPESYPGLLSEKRREVKRITKENNELLCNIDDKKQPLREALKAWNWMVMANISESKTLLELVGEVHQAKGINKLIHRVIAGNGDLTLKKLEKEMMKVFEETEKILDV